VARQYGPDEPWPEHPKSWFRDALAVARRAGWSLKKLQGHSWGIVRCPAADTSRQHKYLVFSSGRAGEDAARELERQVRCCPHGIRADADPLSIAEEHAQAAERHVQAAEQLSTSERQRQRASELLDIAAESMDEAEQMLMLELAVDLDQAATEADEVILEDVEAGGVGSNSAHMLDQAEAEVAAGQRVLRGQSGGAVRLIRERLATVRKRSTELRSQLGDV